MSPLLVPCIVNGEMTFISNDSSYWPLIADDRVYSYYTSSLKARVYDVSLHLSTLCLAVWIAFKHFRELPTGWTVEDLLSGADVCASTRPHPSIRQYNAKVVAESDEATAMISTAFQQRTQMSNDNNV